MMRHVLAMRNNMRTSAGKGFVAFMIFWGFSLLISIAFSVACCVIAWHFIAKFW
jgi:hypothetical protein